MHECATSETRRNIQSVDDLMASGLKPGDKVHVGVCGNHVSDDAVYRGMYWDEHDPGRVRGVRIDIGGTPVEPPLDWGDIIELWPID